jgi:septum formation protein
MAKLRTLVLASTSPYRREMLERLELPFQCVNPGVDEQPVAGESPAGRAVRLSAEKARAVASRFPDALILGSDQVASLDGEVLRKPGTHDNALRQLEKLSGRTALFDTAIALLDSRSGTIQSKLVSCKVTYRTLSAAQIEAYVLQERPYDCAGSAKAERLGIALIAAIESKDPTALIGLPLIALTTLLSDAGMPVLPPPC